VPTLVEPCMSHVSGDGGAAAAVVVPVLKLVRLERRTD